jgi:hypothetical protein
MKKITGYISVLVAFLALIATGCSSTMPSAAKTDMQLHPDMHLTVGQEVYACNCGAKCPCNTLSHNPGKCTCGVDLVQAKVKSVGDGTAMLMVNGEERTFKTRGKYACACSPKCPCNTISQNPGKCTCGVDMAKVN